MKKIKFPLVEEAKEKFKKLDELKDLDILDEATAFRLKQKIRKNLVKQLV